MMTAEKFVSGLREKLAAGNLDANFIVEHVGSGSVKVRIETECAAYGVRIEGQSSGLSNDHGWATVSATEKESGQPYSDWLVGGDVSGKTCAEMAEGIFIYEKGLAEDQEFAAGWDSLEDAHGARLAAGLGSDDD